MEEIPTKKRKLISIDSKPDRVQLGGGNFGNVFKGKFKGRPVAVKKVLLQNWNEEGVNAMKQLDHPNIVKLFHCESDRDFRHYALELCNASLDRLFLDSDHPQKYKGPMPRHIEVFHQLASGLEHIHSKNFIHRDIKPKNILISLRTAGENEEITIKWADFGLSRTVNERGTFTMKSGIKLTKKWLAPEILRLLGKGEEGRGDVRSDVFALALVFGYFLLGGQHLYGSIQHNEQIIRNIIEGKPINMQQIDEKLRGLYEDELLKKMLEDDPTKRMTSTEIVHQLNSIKEKLTKKEEELRQLCCGDSQFGLNEKVKDLIDFGIDVNAKDRWKSNALHLLCENNSSVNLTTAIQILVQSGIDVNAKIQYGSNALHLLCINNSSEHLADAIKILAQSGTDVNAKDQNGQNALHLLCENNLSKNLTDAIGILIQYGIDVNAKDGHRRKAIDYLLFNNDNWKAIQILKKATSTDFSKPTYGKSEDEKFVERDGKLRKMRPNNFLSPLSRENKVSIQGDNDANMKDKGERNALHVLCQHNSSSSLINEVKHMIEVGHKVNDKDKDGRNALHYLCRYNSSSDLRGAIQILIDNGIKVEEKTNEGWNALHFTCQNNSNSKLVEILSILIEKGVDVNEKTKSGESAIDILAKSEIDENLKSNVLRFLIRHGIQMHLDNKASPNVNKYFIKQDDNYGEQFLNLLAKQEIRLGWHEECKNCNQILLIKRKYQVGLQHHHRFGSCYKVFHLLMKNLETWAKSNQKSGELELDMSNPTGWLRKKAEQYYQSETEKRYKEDLEVMAEVSEQVQDGNESGDFNCDNYERYLRSMYSIAEMIGSNQSMGQIKWFYLLPFDFPMDYENEKDSNIKRAKIEWDKTLYSWAHNETDTCYGRFMKENANEGFFLPDEFKHKCHSEL
ncbi:uncharacterized protein LOC130695214 [Daphnia carinata]|uniref:uncharacterized protein LOC130695214 n=1 Tax=Daphnia carinata TaxID=120202 RepID=UPI0025794582|nr:uncharacterized protein LOC130695214 [Daphnia carinata]